METKAAALAQIAQWQDLANNLLRRAAQAGASAAEIELSGSRGLNVNVRMGEVETVEFTCDRGLSLTVYLGEHKGSADSADLSADSITKTLDQALAIARFTEADACHGLADSTQLATTFPDLDLWHPWMLGAPEAIALGQQIEAAGRSFDPRIVNSDGASVSTTVGYGIYANSHGFVGSALGSRHSMSCALLAQDQQGMQRDDEYTVARHIENLANAAWLGRRVAEKTLARLAPRKVKTQKTAVLFAAPVARSIWGHLLGALGGSAQYRKATFLLDSVGTQVLPNWVSLVEQPMLPGALASACFDDEGVAPSEDPIVAGGVVERYLLGSYSARRLGLRSTGNAGGVRNVRVSANAADQQSMLKQMGRGLLVTELMGQGVNGLTGDYSRGASGFWVENGEIAYPVDEVTIAGNLKLMLQQLLLSGADVDLRGSVRSGSLLIDGMTLAGS